MDPDSAVEEIVSEVGDIAGYTNLNLYNLRATNMMLKIVFEGKRSNQKATSKGLSMNGMVYPGIPV